MIRTLLLLVAAWFAVVPSLCLAGAVAHACDDCRETTCAHEDECADDPCAESALPAAPGPDARPFGPATGLVATPATAGTAAGEAPGDPGVPPPAVLPPRLPGAHPSDRPLRL